jgi:hypothetical protein
MVAARCGSSLRVTSGPRARQTANVASPGFTEGAHAHAPRPASPGFRLRCGDVRGRRARGLRIRAGLDPVPCAIACPDGRADSGSADRGCVTGADRGCFGRADAGSEITKNGEGGHGGPPLVDLPAAFVVDYKVTGTCTFQLSFEPADMSTAVQVRSVTVSGTSKSGAWDVQLTPGKYYVHPNEAVGCTFHIEVHSPS